MSSLNSNWEDEMEKRITEKIGVLRVDFDHQIKELEEKTYERLQKSEDKIINQFREIQQANNNELKLSFQDNMDAMDNKLDAFLKQFQTTLLSTGSAGTIVSAADAGKN